MMCEHIDILCDEKLCRNHRKHVSLFLKANISPGLHASYAISLIVFNRKWALSHAIPCNFQMTFSTEMVDNFVMHHEEGYIVKPGILCTT